MHETDAASDVVVQHEHVRMAAVELLRELGYRWRRCDHGHIGLRIDEPAQAGQHGGVIIQERESDH